MGSWPSVAWLYILPKLWINENFPERIALSSLKEQRATHLIVLMLSPLGTSKVFFSSPFLVSPAPAKCPPLFQAFPYEIKISRWSGVLTTLLRSQNPVQLHRKKK